jgi:hypothetical protein
MREPWEVAPILAGWQPNITLSDGIREIAAVAGWDPSDVR